MRNTKLHGLYAITPDMIDGQRLLAQVEAALAGGCQIVQFRDKISSMTERVARAHALRALTQRHRALLLINDDLALCQLVDADGVHLGREDGDLRITRAILGPQRILGASCYADLNLARAAEAAGANYVAFGAAFPSPTKPEAPPATVDLFLQAKTTLTAKICAIGGITHANAPHLTTAGVDLLAVITDLFSAPDITARAAEFQRLFENTTP